LHSFFNTFHIYAEMKNVLLITFVVFAACTPKNEPSLPNIIYILADDLGYGDVRTNNAASRIQTPNIDQLASQGMRFTDAHSPSSVCTPTRYGILTGRYCWRTRLPRGVLLGYGQALIEANETTVAEYLQEEGYQTGVVGKWHLGLDWKIRDDCKDSIASLGEQAILRNVKSDWIDFSQPTDNGPLAHGFDYSYILPASLDFEPYCYLENDRLTHPLDSSTEGSQPYGYTGAFWRKGLMSSNFDFFEVLPRFIDKATAFVKERASNDQPFFLYLPLAAPHTPWMPKPEYRDRSAAGEYGDFVQMVDAQVGRFLKALDEFGVSDNTLLIFTSDNGPYWTPEFIERFDHRAAKDFRGMKGDAWDAGHRVPFLVRWPGVVEANTQSNQITSLTNFFATAAEVTNVVLPDGAAMDSQSILQVLKGGSTNNQIPVIHHSSRGTFAIRQGDWKYIDGLGSGGFTRPAIIEPEEDGPKGQLYNMRDDPGEENNLYLQNPKKVEELQQKLSEIKDRN